MLLSKARPFYVSNWRYNSQTNGQRNKLEDLYNNQENKLFLNKPIMKLKADERYFHYSPPEQSPF